MNIEVSPSVPVLRLNSVAIEDGEESGEITIRRSRCPSNCSSSEYFQSSDAESYCSDRSGSGPVSRVKRTSENEVLTEEQRAEVMQRLVAQAEFLFSDEHLANDGFLLKHIRRRSDGFVSLKLVAGLRKIKQISRDFPLVVEALRLSLKLDVNCEGTKVRRMDPLTPFLINLPLSSELKAKKTKDVPVGELTEADLLNRVTLKSQKSNKLDRSPSPSPVSSNASSRHGSFSKQRGQNRSMPIPISIPNSAANTKHSNHSHSPSPRRKNLFLSPNSSPRSSSFGNKEQFQLQRSMKASSYSEGIAAKVADTQHEVTVTGTSAWLQERRRSSSENAVNSGSKAVNAIIRQPFGPDGTKGFGFTSPKL